MSGQQYKPHEAYMLSIVSGIIILIGSVSWITLTALGWAQGWFDWFGGYMHGVWGHMGFLNFENLGFLMGLPGLFSGAGIVLASTMLNRRPDEHGTWGLLIVVFSVTSMMAGLWIGLLLGIVGGVLAILWQPPRAVSTGSVQQA